MIEKMMDETQLRYLLQSELRHRAFLNPRYSLRSFAKFLKMDPSLLSKFLHGQRGLSKNSKQKILERLKVSDNPRTRSTEVNYAELQPELFDLISGWEYFAILELTKTRTGVVDAKQVAQRLHISRGRAQHCLDLLLQNNLISLNGKGFKATNAHLSWNHSSWTSLAKKKLQAKYLALALQAIEQFSFDKREHSSLTVACSPDLLPEVKNKIAQFKLDLDTWLEKNQVLHSDVYQLCIAFFPLTQKGEVK